MKQRTVGWRMGAASSMLGLAALAQMAPPSLPSLTEIRDSKRAEREAIRMQRMQEPLPESGSTTTFTFLRSSQYAGVYEIYPHGDPEPSLVSESYLRIILGNVQLGDEMRLTTLMAYPVMALRWFDMVMPRHYPDASSPASPEPFPRRTLSLADGSQLTVEQDPLAPPYVRVRMVNAEGRVEEFSISRAMAEEILSSRQATDAEKFEQFQTYLYRLPEQARYDFKRLTPEELYELAARAEPLAQKDEWTRMRNIIEDQIRAQAAAAGKTNTVREVREGYIEKIKAEWQPKMAGAGPRGHVATSTGTVAQGSLPPRALASSSSHAEESSATARSTARTSPGLPPPRKGNWGWAVGTIVIAGALAAFAFWMGRRTR